MGAALVLLLVGLGALAAGVLIGRYYLPDDRQLRRTARHSRAYMRALASLYEEQARFNEAAGLWGRLGKRRNEDTSLREHHLLVAAAQAALARGDDDSAKQLLKAARKHQETAHFFAAAAELAAAR